MVSWEDHVSFQIVPCSSAMILSGVGRGVGGGGNWAEMSSKTTIFSKT